MLCNRSAWVGLLRLQPDFRIQISLRKQWKWFWNQFECDFSPFRIHALTWSSNEELFCFRLEVFRPQPCWFALVNLSPSPSPIPEPWGSLGHHRWFHNQFPPFFYVFTALWDLANSRPVHFLMFLCCALKDRFGWTWWRGDRSIPFQFASLYDGQEVFMWSDCLLDLGTDFLVGHMSLYE